MDHSPLLFLSIENRNRVEYSSLTQCCDDVAIRKYLYSEIKSYNIIMKMS